jgi:anthranilate phosphoribosyltransferase
MSRADLSDIRGGDVQKNADIVLSVLKGESGAKRDMVLLNAAAALVAAGRAADFPEGITLAAESIDSGRALQKLEGLKRVTNDYKE